MSDKMILIVGLCFTAITIFIYFISTRSSRAFQSVFGETPKQATQEMVDKKIQELRERLSSHEEKLPRLPTEEDRDKAGFTQIDLERAKKLAQKYGFRVPE